MSLYDLLNYAPTWAGVAILADIVTGYYQAWCNSCIQSKAMREGLQRKGAEALLIIVVVIINIAVTHAKGLNIPADYTGLIEMISVNGVSGYIILKEVTSVCENLCKANPELKTLPFMNRLETSQPETSTQVGFMHIEDNHAGDTSDNDTGAKEVE